MVGPLWFRDERNVRMPKANLLNIESLLLKRGINWEYGMNGSLIFTRDDGTTFHVGNDLTGTYYSVFCLHSTPQEVMEEIFGEREH